MLNELHLTKKDFKIEWYSGTGGGGQHRNKHQNCCRITHIETGMVENGTAHRDRPSNQKDAFTRLAKRVVDFYFGREPPERIIEGEKIRLYHAERNEVIDHASGHRQSFGAVLDDPTEMVEARKKAL